MHFTTLHMRNHWDIYVHMSLHHRDWINSVRLSSQGIKFWPPHKFYFKITGILYLSNIAYKSCPLFVPASPLLPQCKDHLYPKIILQAYCHSTVITSLLTSTQIHINYISVMYHSCQWYISCHFLALFCHLYPRKNLVCFYAQFCYDRLEC